MLFFGTSKKCISKDKFEHDVRRHLFNADFSHKELDEIEEIFRGDLESKNAGYDKAGMTKDEMESGLNWMKENMDIHKISEKKINELEETLRKQF